MENKNKIKELVRQKYGEIAESSSCCSTNCCSSTEVYTIMSEDYSSLSGYNADANLGLGCGLPTEFAAIKQGDTVIDLGSGAGNDCFVARSITGETGQVIGIDFTPEMVAKAKANAEKLSYNNVFFYQGDIENMPVEDKQADVIISNCVLNLLPAKDKIFHEIFRVLKPGGHFCISDIVIVGQLPKVIKDAAEMYVGCVAGAMQKIDYITEIKTAGFDNVKIQKEKSITIPDDILLKYLDAEQLESFKRGTSAIVSITVTAYKPSGCMCGTNCCQ